MTTEDIENLLIKGGASSLRRKHYLQERVQESDSYDQIMDKIAKAENERTEQEDWNKEREAEKLFKAEQERQQRELVNLNVDVATVNDLFKGWVDDEDEEF